MVVVDVLEGDDPPDPTQEFDVVPLWADDVDPTPAGSLQVDADGQPLTATDPDDKTPPRAKRSDRGPKRFLALLAVGAILVASFAAFAAWARRGYYVDFNDNDVVTIFKGRTDGVLWFDPTEENTGPPREILDDESVVLVEMQPRFDSRIEAALFIREDLSTIPTTTIPIDHDHHRGDRCADLNGPGHHDSDYHHSGDHHHGALIPPCRLLLRPTMSIRRWRTRPVRARQ